LKSFDENDNFIISNGFMVPQKLPKSAKKQSQNDSLLRAKYETEIPLRKLLHKMKLDLLQESIFTNFVV